MTTRHKAIRLTSAAALLAGLSACAVPTTEDPLDGLQGITVVDGLYEGQLPEEPAPDAGAIIFRTGS